jgi:signal transduction histidine kinase
MKIRNRITLIFVLLTALLMLVKFVFIYFFSQRHTDKEFYLKLRQRATIAADAFLKEDDVSATIYSEILAKHLETLPHERERIYQVIEGTRALETEPDSIYPPNFIRKIFKNHYAEARIGDFHYAGILYHDNEGDFIVVISAEDIDGADKMRNLRNILILTFFLSIAILFILGRYYAKQVLNPIARIISRVNRIRVTNLHLRLDPGNGKDELSELAFTFNNMLDRLETSFELQTNFINNASHELRNPLTAILGQTEVALSKERHRDEYISSLQSIEREASRLDILVNSLLRLAQTDYRQKGLLLEPIRIDEMLLDVKTSIDKLNPENRVSLDFTCLPDNPEALTVEGNYSLLNVALNNVVDNACKFSENRDVQVKIAANGANYLSISVTDMGIGIPDEELKNVYEPFFRGSNANKMKGFGFGLPLAYKIIKMHRGQVEIKSRVGLGTEVVITLPTGKESFFRS